MAYTIDHVTVYWAEAHDGERAGWCAAIHTIDDVDCTELPPGIRTEAEAIEWAEARYPGETIRVGADDIV